MNTNEKNFARQISLEEIKELPKGSVIWMAYVRKEDTGIVWHGTDPAMICVPGEDGYVIGGGEGGTYDYLIDDLVKTDYTLWNVEPDDSQLPGISTEEYNAMRGEENIVLTELAAAITARKMTFERFSEKIGMNYSDLWDLLTGKIESVQCVDLAAIMSTLNVTDEKLTKLFSPAALAQI